MLEFKKLGNIFMKKVLCYGDSNTFGFNPEDGSRFDKNTRWTGILQSILGSDYEIIEEGASNRNGFVDNPSGFLYSGSRHFPKIIAKKKDVDILVLAVGTNDLQFLYDVSFSKIENGLEKLIVEAKKRIRNIYLVPPVVLNEDVLKGVFNYQFDETSIAKSKKVGKIYTKLAKVYGCRVFDINDFAHPSPKDGLHYDENAHQLIAENLAASIQEIW